LARTKCHGLTKREEVVEVDNLKTNEAEAKVAVRIRIRIRMKGYCERMILYTENLEDNETSFISMILMSEGTASKVMDGSEILEKSKMKRKPVAETRYYSYILYKCEAEWRKRRMLARLFERHMKSDLKDKIIVPKAYGQIITQVSLKMNPSTPFNFQLCRQTKPLRKSPIDFYNLPFRELQLTRISFAAVTFHLDFQAVLKFLFHGC